MGILLINIKQIDFKGESKMSNEALIGILVTVVCAVSAFFIVSKRNVIKINPKTKSGKIDMSKSEYTSEKHIYENKK